jgi:hypothetical protein
VGIEGLFSEIVVDKSALLSVDPLSDASLLSVDPLSDASLLSVDPLSDASLLSVDPLSDASLLSSGLVLAPLAYMIAEVGKTIEIMIKNINEILI